MMKLNIDTCFDLTQEILILSCKDAKLISRFMLSGKETLVISKKAIKKIDTAAVHFEAHRRSKGSKPSHFSRIIALILVSFSIDLIYVTNSAGRAHEDRGRVE